jgi:outer membrane protein assembly factor BamE (lipoprotein component of BamABCDE complex)
MNIFSPRSLSQNLKLNLLNRLNSPLLNLLLLFAILLQLSSCQTVNVRGQYVSDEIISEISKKKMGKDEIVNLIGSPNFIPDYSANTWYYIQRSLTKRAWFDPKVVDQRIIRIIFTNEHASDIKLLSNTQDENLSVASGYTKTLGTEKNAVQKYVQNFARFNKSKKGKTKRKKRN